MLMGGDSGEREISLRSGAAAAAALRRLGYRVEERDVRDPLQIEQRPPEADVCFLTFHGGFGEDGRVQRILEDLGVPYTGSDSIACDLAMDKLKAKILFRLHGLSTPPFRVLGDGACPEAAERAAAEVGYPVVVKPRSGGSSLGISIHDDDTWLWEGVEKAFEYGSEVLLERQVLGMELTVGVLGDRILPLVRVRAAGRFFDYAAKYQAPDTDYAVDPDDIPDGVRRSARESAWEAHCALRCRDLSRTDMMVDESGTPWLLEVNALPGLTERSLFPKAAAKAGIGYEELCETLVRMALHRGRRRGLAPLLSRTA